MLKRSEKLRIKNLRDRILAAQVADALHRADLALLKSLQEAAKPNPAQSKPVGPPGAPLGQ